MNKLILLVISLCFNTPLENYFQNEKRENVLLSQNVVELNRSKPSLVRGPYLQAATSNSIVIRWRTDVLARSVVRYGDSINNLSMVAIDSALVFDHEVKIMNLSPEEKYFYSVGDFKDTLQGGADNYFKTLPVAGQQGKYRIGVFGDCGIKRELQAQVKDQFLKYLGNDYLNAWILLGDNAYDDGSDLQYQMYFFNSYKEDLLKKYPLYPSPGNHDYHDYDFSAAMAKKTHDIPYYYNFTMPVNGEAGGVASHNPAYYSFDIGNVHFLSLDSYGEEDYSTRIYDTLGAQVQWVKKDLEANKNTDWVVVYFHHPPYSMGSHNSDKENELIKIRENFIGILERYGVDLILCGHSHSYERSKMMKGYYGPEASFDSAKYNLSQSSGKYDRTSNSCPYIKSSKNNQGTVYVVNGVAAAVGRRKQESFPHEAMPYSNRTYGGASIIEVEGNRLDMKWICADGEIRDQFTMMKNVNKNLKLTAKEGEIITLTASYIGEYKWNKSLDTTRNIQVKAGLGNSTYMVKDPNNCLEDRFEIVVDNDL